MLGSGTNLPTGSAKQYLIGPFKLSRGSYRRPLVLLFYTKVITPKPKKCTFARTLGNHYSKTYLAQYYNSIVTMTLLTSSEQPHHYGIFVANHDTSVQWYTQILGFVVVSSFDFGGYKGSYVQGGGFLIEIVENRNVPYQSQYPSNAHLAFRVDDLEERATKARQLNISLFIEPTVNPAINMKFFHVLDPDGHVLEFTQAL